MEVVSKEIGGKLIKLRSLLLFRKHAVSSIAMKRFLQRDWKNIYSYLFNV